MLEPNILAEIQVRVDKGMGMGIEMLNQPG